MKIKRQFGVGKGESNRKDLERLVFFLMKRGASGEFCAKEGHCLIYF